jgi:hypothetical protein
LLNKHIAVSADVSVFKELSEGKKKWVRKFIKKGLAFIGANSIQLLMYFVILNQ